MTKKEKIFKKFIDSLNKMNSTDGLSDYHFSKIYNMAERLEEKEYQQGRADAIEEILKIADCAPADCWDCAFGDGNNCKLKTLYKGVAE